MAAEFRMVPRTARYDKSGPCWALRIHNHPLGIETAVNEYYPAGSYIASWRTRDEAETAARCLGMDPINDVYSSFVCVPQMDATEQADG